MISFDTMPSVRHGCYVLMVLKDGPTLSGYAGADPEAPELLRFDTLVAEERGELCEASLRLLPEQIEKIEFLARPPQFATAVGSTITMRPYFWSNAEE